MALIPTKSCSVGQISRGKAEREKVGAGEGGGRRGERRRETDATLQVLKQTQVLTGQVARGINDCREREIKRRCRVGWGWGGVEEAWMSVKKLREKKKDEHLKKKKKKSKVGAGELKLKKILLSKIIFIF